MSSLNGGPPPPPATGVGQASRRRGRGTSSSPTSLLPFFKGMQVPKRPHTKLKPKRSIRDIAIEVHSLVQALLPLAVARKREKPAEGAVAGSGNAESAMAVESQEDQDVDSRLRQLQEVIMKDGGSGGDASVATEDQGRVDSLVSTDKTRRALKLRAARSLSQALSAPSGKVMERADINSNSDSNNYNNSNNINNTIGAHPLADLIPNPFALTLTKGSPKKGPTPVVAQDLFGGVEENEEEEKEEELGPRASGEHLPFFAAAPCLTKEMTRRVRWLRRRLAIGVNTVVSEMSSAPATVRDSSEATPSPPLTSWRSSVVALFLSLCARDGLWGPFLIVCARGRLDEWEVRRGGEEKRRRREEGIGAGESL